MEKVIKNIDVTVVGGGMITQDLILPVLYHMQRTGSLGEINICALNSTPLKNLNNNSIIREAFPGQEFTPYPSLDEPEDKLYPDLYGEVISRMKPYQAVVVALPDQFHFEAVKTALSHDQHVMCVKPLVLKYEQAVEIETLAKERGLFVGIEYHKRFDRRSLLARKDYQKGLFGEFAIGEAQMIEPYYYRFSNFQNWFTADKTDPFVYVGCHYVDLVYFITGLKPVSVSVEGVKRAFPNGNIGFLWSFGRVRYENGALLNVTDGLGYPDQGAGANDQGLKMYCEGDGKSGMILHDDQFRGVAYSYLESPSSDTSMFNYVNPDFFKLVPWEGDGFKPVGYGTDSVSSIIETIRHIDSETDGLGERDAFSRRKDIIDAVEEKGIIATPANSYINELVNEAARISILGDGTPVNILYGDNPHVERR
ncbi:Gfo/Idh/MocA family protein [Candidatus Latescibacterota bacterium]